MSVNSANKGFFNNRLAMKPGITVVVIAIFLIASSFTKHPGDLRMKQVNLMIRQIGHRLLLLAGDSTSRVLPVTKIKEGTFQLTFEKEFSFSDDSLIMLSQDLLPKTEFPSGYTVTVHEAANEDIVYGFQVSNTPPGIIACQGRSQPLGHYRIEIAFPDLYEKVEPKKSIKQEKAEIVQPVEEPKPIATDLQQVVSKPAELKTTTLQSESRIEPPPGLSYSLITLAFSGTLVLLGVTLLLGRLGKILNPVPVANPDPPISKEFRPEFAALGKFSFDVKGQRLLLGDQVISLTEKECRILELLNKNFGELIPRETLMQKIWISEGVITGRSLDMFVSKLRKKLSGDVELRITNVHGKGYKLEGVWDRNNFVDR
ncbi:MAG: winged helix-turn-helix domain-containing protein [Bacteroidota bacterium]